MDGPARRPRGSGSIRERRTGVFELRVTVHPAAGTSGQRSVSVHGNYEQAHAVLTRLVAEACRRQAPSPPTVITLAELLDRWLEADHPWKPSTEVGYRSNAHHLACDPLGGTRAQQLTPSVVRDTVRRWRADDVTQAVVAARFRVLRAALSWGYEERLLDVHPIRHMRGPSRVPPRRPLDDAAVHRILITAEADLLEAIANDTGTNLARARRHTAELDLLLARLAADTGARRGELAGLQRGDLDGRVLRIDRAESAGLLTTPKSGQGRRLTLGAGTAGLWQDLERTSRERVDASDARLGPWLFGRDALHQGRLTAGALGHRFARLRDRAGVPQATLHRLRHHVATFLVARGEILQAQYRLGHADAATTLREYAYALPLTDQDIAQALDRHLDELGASKPPAHSFPSPGAAPPDRR